MATDTQATPKHENLLPHEQWLHGEGRKLALAQVEASEKFGRQLVELHERAAQDVPFAPARPVIQAQATFIRQVTDAYAGAAREALK
jgi:hypothetical protein